MKDAPIETQVEGRGHHVPGSLVVTVLVGSMIAFAMWMATQRTVLIDDPQRGAGNRAPGGVQWPDMRVNVNTASAAELSLLHGIGPALAERIVAERSAHGRFASLDDLGRVPGVGEAIIDRLRPHAVAE